MIFTIIFIIFYVVPVLLCLLSIWIIPDAFDDIKNSILLRMFIPVINFVYLMVVWGIMIFECFYKLTHGKYYFEKDYNS